MRKSNKHPYRDSQRPQSRSKIAALRLLPIVFFIVASSLCITASITSRVRAFESKSYLSGTGPIQTGAVSFDGVWQFIDESAIALDRANVSRPIAYSTFRLNIGAIERVLDQAPAEFTPQAKTDQVLMSLAMPDGSFKRFMIEYSPVMEPELADLFPNIKSYRGQGIDDATATARFDWTPLGFHAIVISSSGTVYISPYSTSDVSNYVSYYLHDLQDGFFAPQCLVDEAIQATAVLQGQLDTRESNLSTGTTLRNYRLAIGTTVEYTNNSIYGGGKSATLTKLATIVNLINAI